MRYSVDQKLELSMSEEENNLSLDAKSIPDDIDPLTPFCSCDL